MRVLRACARAGSALAALLGLAQISGPAGAADTAPDISGTYWATSYSPKIQVVDGGEPPLNAAGKAAYEANQKGLKDGSVVD